MLLTDCMLNGAGSLHRFILAYVYFSRAMAKPCNSIFTTSFLCNIEVGSRRPLHLCINHYINYLYMNHYINQNDCKAFEDARLISAISYVIA